MSAPSRVVLLRGINIGSRNRVAMPALREALGEAGFGDVRTYVQSGNVVLRSGDSPDDVGGACERVIKDTFGLEVSVIVRTVEELSRVVELNPLGNVAVNPKRYQVSFLAEEPPPELVEKLQGLKAPEEELAAAGRELYAWHPDGVARSKLWAALGGQRLGVTATSRNWTTVTTLLEMAQEG